MTKKSNVEKIRTIKAKNAKAKKPTKQKNVLQNANLGQKAKRPNRKDFPSEFPFWARLKISKHRTTLVIDDENYFDKKLNKNVNGFVHREATSKYHKGFEEIKPNPDRTKKDPMYLKSPRKLPKRLFEVHNKKLVMPKFLKDRYSKNNEK